MAENRRCVPWAINDSLFDCSGPPSYSFAEQSLDNDPAALSIECDIEDNLPDAGDFADLRRHTTQWAAFKQRTALLPRAVGDRAVLRSAWQSCGAPRLALLLIIFAC